MDLSINEILGGIAFGASPSERRGLGLCVSCGKFPPADMSEAGVREFRISGLCEPCFDALIPPELDVLVKIEIPNGDDPELRVTGNLWVTGVDREDAIAVAVYLLDENSVYIDWDLQSWEEPPKAVDGYRIIATRLDGGEWQEVRDGEV